MPKFVKKYPPIEAMQWTGTLDSAREVDEWIGPEFRLSVVPDLLSGDITGLRTSHKAALLPGQWVVRENGDPPLAMNDDDFQRTYAAAGA